MDGTQITPDRKLQGSVGRATLAFLFLRYEEAPWKEVEISIERFSLPYLPQRVNCLRLANEPDKMRMLMYLSGSVLELSWILKKFFKEYKNTLKMSVIRKKINSGTWYFITHCLSHPNMNTTAL